MSLFRLSKQTQLGFGVIFLQALTSPSDGRQLWGQPKQNLYSSLCWSELFEGYVCVIYCNAFGLFPLEAAG